MSDRSSYIEAGVRCGWMVRYHSGQVITEFSTAGNITKLKEVVWKEVSEFSAYDIKDCTEEPIPIVTFQFHENCTPIWYHRSIGYIGSKGLMEPKPMQDFIGVETEAYKNYACIEGNGSIRILFENKG